MTEGEGRRALGLEGACRLPAHGGGSGPRPVRARSLPKGRSLHLFEIAPTRSRAGPTSIRDLDRKDRFGQSSVVTLEALVALRGLAERFSAKLAAGRATGLGLRR